MLQKIKENLALARDIGLTIYGLYYQNTILNNNQTALSILYATRLANVNDVIPEIDSMYDSDGARTIHFAVEKNNIDLVRFLISKKADLNIQTNRFRSTPLHFAKTPEMVRLLLENGADATIQNIARRTAQEWFSDNDREDLVAIIEEHVANNNNNKFARSFAKLEISSHITPDMAKICDEYLVDGDITANTETVNRTKQKFINSAISSQIECADVAKICASYVGQDIGARSA